MQRQGSFGSEPNPTNIPGGKWKTGAPLPGYVVPVKRSDLISLNRRGMASSNCYCGLDAAALLLPPTNVHENEILKSRWTPNIPLSRCQLHELISALPVRFQNNGWKTIFDTTLHGHSMQHFYRMMEEERGSSGVMLFHVLPKHPRTIGPSSTLTPSPPNSSPAFNSPDSSSTALRASPSAFDEFAARDPCRPAPLGTAVIGVFLGELPTTHHGQHHFFGGRETFVFRFPDSTMPLAPAVKKDNVAHDEDDDCTSKTSSLVDTFRWSGKNEDFMVCHHSFLGIGGGGGSGAAIYINDDLQTGSTSSFCQTFASPILCGEQMKTLDQAEFEIIQMAVYSLDSPYVDADLMPPLETMSFSTSKPTTSKAKPTASDASHTPLVERDIGEILTAVDYKIRCRKCPRPKVHQCSIVDDFIARHKAAALQRSRAQQSSGTSGGGSFGSRAW